MRALSRCLFLISLCGIADAASGLPDWLTEAAAHPVPTYPVKVPSVVLLQEEAVTVNADGSRVMRERGAIKLLQPGSDNVRAYRTYNAKDGRIRDMREHCRNRAGEV